MSRRWYRERIHIYLPMAKIAQMNLLAYNPSNAQSGIGELVTKAWDFYLNNYLRKNVDLSKYPEIDMNTANVDEKLVEMRRRVLNKENITQEEYAEVLELLRAKRGTIRSTSTSNGVKKEVVLPKDLNELFGG